MGATLDALHRLQEIELQSVEIQRRIDRKERRCKQQKKRITDIDSTIQALQEHLHTDQLTSSQLNLEAKTKEEEIARSRITLNTAKTNKEYSAVLTQLNTFKTENSKLEERLLVLISQIEERESQIEKNRQERQGEVTKLEELEKDTREVEQKAQGRLSQLKQERDQAADNVPGIALDIFNRVASKHDGEAMALVIRTNPKRQEYACDGCNMSITLEQVNAILSRDDAVLCNVCGRILYMESPAASNAR